MTDRNINAIAKRCFDINEEKGFHEGYDWSPEAVLSKLMLVCGEMGEASEDVRDQHMALTYRERDGKPEGFPSELADGILRLLDIAVLHDINIAHVIEEKLAYNATRPKYHGRAVSV